MTKILNETLKKKMYKSQILNLLHTKGALSQISICKALGLPKTTVSSIVNNAIKSDLIKKLGEEPGQRNVPGIRPVLLGLEDTKSLVLGLSVRNGFLYSGLVNFHGDVIQEQSSKLNSFKSEELPKLINEEVNKTQEYGKNILGTGLAIGGYFTGSNKSLIPESKYLNVSTGIPLIADDYPNAAAIAELLFGKAKGKDNFVFLELGESHHRVSCYSNGNIVRGTHGMAGEVSAMEDVQKDVYKTPFYRYQHSKIKHYENSSLNEIEENSYFLANMLLQIMVYYDPRRIIISGVPEEIWNDKVNKIIDRVIKEHLNLDLYGFKYEIVRESQWQNKEIIYGASLIFEDILMRPRIKFNESVINF
jgi:predicted NBD/HSP70 family sugar kinase